MSATAPQYAAAPALLVVQSPYAAMSPVKKERKTYPMYFAPDTPLLAKILCQGVSEFRGFAAATKIGKDITISLPYGTDGKTATIPVVDTDRLFHEANWQRALDSIYTCKSDTVRALLNDLTPVQQIKFIRMSADEGRAFLLGTKRPIDIHSLGVPASRCDKAGRKLVPVFQEVAKPLRFETTKTVYTKDGMMVVETTKNVYNGNHAQRIGWIMEPAIGNDHMDFDMATVCVHPDQKDVFDTTTEDIVFNLLFKNKACPVDVEQE